MDQSRKALDTSNSTTVKVINFVAIKVKGAENRKKVESTVSTQVYINDIPETNPSLAPRKVCQVEKRTIRPDKKKEDPIKHKPKTPSLQHSACKMISNHHDNVVWEEGRDDAAVISNDIAMNASPKIHSIEENAELKPQVQVLIVKEDLHSIEIEQAFTNVNSQKASKDIENRNNADTHDAGSPLIFSESKSNFITDTFLLSSMYGGTYAESAKDSESDTSANTSTNPSPSFQGSWRTRLGSIEEPENSTTSKTRIDRLNQDVVDVKKARARYTISNVLNQQKRANM